MLHCCCERERQSAFLHGWGWRSTGRPRAACFEQSPCFKMCSGHRIGGNRVKVTAEYKMLWCNCINFYNALFVDLLLSYMCYCISCYFLSFLIYFFLLPFILISCFHAIFVFPLIKNFEKCAYFLCLISCFFSSRILISSDRRLILRVSLMPLPVRISLRAALWIQSQVQVCWSIQLWCFLSTAAGAGANCAVHTQSCYKKTSLQCMTMNNEQAFALCLNLKIAIF